MKLKRVLSLILAAAIMLSFLPSGVLPIHAVPADGNYQTGYTWSFDQNVTPGDTKGLVDGNAAGNVKVMNHEGNNSLTPGRAIVDGVLTTTVTANWGNTVGHAVFYKLPADLTAGKTYKLSLNLFGGNEAAAMNGITLSFGSYADIIGGAGWQIQKWNISQVESMHTDSKVTHTITGNLPTAADNAVVIEFEAGEYKADSWMLVTFPMALDGSYKLGSATLTEKVDYTQGYTWSFDKTIESFGKNAEFKGIVYGNAAATLGILNHEGYGSGWGSNTSRSLKDGLLKSKLTASWEEAGHGIYYKLPEKLVVGKTYVVSMNLYAAEEDTPMTNDKSGSITVSFSSDVNGTQEWRIVQMEAYHNTQNKFSIPAPASLSTRSDNVVSFEFEATQEIVDAGSWMLVTFPMEDGKTYVLGDTTIEEKTAFGNLIVNGSFDNGETGWGKNANFTAGSVTDGVLVVPATKTGGDAIFYQGMNLTPGTYQLSFDGKGTANQYRPILYIGINQWSKVYGEHFLKNFGFGEDWKNAAVTFTVPETAADATTGLAPVFVALWTSNGSYAPETEMQFDNFEVRKCFSASVVNSEGEAATGLAPYTLPNAANGAPFRLTLAPETVNHTMTVSCKMGGKDVPVTVNADGSVTISIDAVNGDIVITADSVKMTYSITTGAGVVNSNPVTTVNHGDAYTANITCGNPNKKLYSVSYTMGGVRVMVPVVDGTAAVNIEAVTGDVTITAVLVEKNLVAQWIFDVTKAIKGNGEWGDAAQTVMIAHNGYYDGKNADNGQVIGTTNVAPDLLTITTNLPAAAAGWADASTVIGYKLPENLELGATYIMNLPIYAGNDHTTMASSKNGSTRSGVELVFTTVQPYNMWNAGDATVTKIYAEGAGVLAAVAPSIGKLTTESGNVFSISFTVTEEIMEYAVTGNYLALIVNHQHSDGSYKIGNASLLKVTDPATVTTDTGDSVCDGAVIAQKGNPYTAQIAPKPGYKVVSAYYTMGGGEPVALTVVNGAVNIKIENVTGDIVITAVTQQLEQNNLLINGTFILGTQFWTFVQDHFKLEEAGGSDDLNDPAYIHSAGKDGGVLSQAFGVEKDTNYELSFRYKGSVPQDAALWAIGSKNTFTWNSVIYKASVADAGDWTTVTVVFNSGNYTSLYLLFRTEDGADYGLDNIWITKTDKEATVTLYKRPVLGARPNPSPYDDHPFICEDADNLMPDFGFETNTHYLENSFSKVEADENAWNGSNSLHYATVITGAEATNMLTNGDFAKWDAANKTIDGWQFQFDHANWMHKIDFVEVGGRHAVKLNACSGTDKFRLEMTQKVYLEAGFTYKFAFDFYGVANWGPNLPIYDANMQAVGTTANSGATGTEGQWTTLTNTFTPASSGYYYFAVRIHNDAYPQREQYVSNCSVTLVSKAGDSKVDFELKELEANTDYWLTLFVKAPKVDSVEDRFLTFGLTDPETGEFILMSDPTAEGGRPYKVDQQLVPMAYDGQWHIITVPFNTGDATWLNFTINGTNCEAWFDNIYIFKASDAVSYVPSMSEKEEATVTDEDPNLKGCAEDKNLFGNFDLSGGNTFWGDEARKFGVFGNALNVVDSGSSIYGKALHYVGNKPTKTYYIKWIDVEPNTEYTFSAKYSIAQMGEGFMGLINGYRVDSEVTENRLFPSMIARFGFGKSVYLESHEWQTVAVSFNSGDRNRIGFVVCDAGGEAYIDELRLFKTSDGAALTEAEDTFPAELKSSNDAVSIQDGVITGIAPGTTLEDVLKNFEHSQYIRVYDAEGNEITDKTAKIGTGSTVRLMDGPEIKDSASVVVKGDVNGDAKADGSDTAVILDHISGKAPLEGALLAAADTDGDGKVTVSDATLNSKKPASGKLAASVVGPSAFAQKEEIEIQLIADTNGLKAISGKLNPTDGLTFLKAEGEKDGWELSVKRSGDDVYFAYGAVSGDAAKAGEALITLTFRVGMISTYDEAQLAITELLASAGTKLLAGSNLNWVRKAPVTEDPDQGGSDTVPEEPVVVIARNRLKELSVAGVKFSPDFDPEIKEYTATVPFEVDKVTVTAVAADEDAVVTIGDTNLEYVGKNTVAIRVVSADGLQRTYKIVITREAPVEPEPTQPVTTEPTDTEPDDQTDGNDIGGVILLGLAGLLLVIALVILIIILKNRKNTKRRR